MGKMSNIESIEQVIFNYGNFRLKTVVNLHKIKQNDKARIANIYSSEYTTKKYLNPLQVKKIVVDTKNFLVLNYYSEESNGSVFLSQANIGRFRDIINFFSVELERIGEGVDYGDDGTPFAIDRGKLYSNPEFILDITTNTGEILFMPSLGKQTIDDGKGIIVPLVKMYIGSKENRTLLPEDAINTLKEVLINYNLLQQSQNLLIISRLYESDFSSIKKRSVDQVPF